MIKKRTGRGRSFRGCITCRQRRLKCDEQRPRCSNCSTASVKCGFDQKNLFFDFEPRNDGTGTRFRQVLFTKEERQEMSEALVAHLDPRHVTKALTEIDETWDGQSHAFDSGIFIDSGPFGVFASRPIEPLHAAIPADEAKHLDGLTERVSHDSLNHTILLEDIDLDILDVDDIVEGNASTVPDRHSFMVDTAHLFDTSDFQLTALSDQLNHSSTSISSPKAPTLANMLCSDIDLNGLTFDAPSISMSIPTSSTSHAPALAEAVVLLNHYTATMVKALSPFEHSKTPWHTLFIALAKNCMASLTLNEEVDHATLCVFYGILAVSAFSRSNDRNEQAESFMASARRHVKSMLLTAYGSIKTAKYKSMLMALLTMVQLSMVAGTQDRIDCYLLEAEKLIRLKGLNRRKTRKVRLLHHCYAFERIFYESLYVNHGETDHRKHVRRAVESSDSRLYSVDSLSFELRSNWSNLETEMLKIKDPETGENDLHLEHLGTWHESMYPEIFGVPEYWIQLLSLTIRLAKMKDALSVTASIKLQEYMLKAKALESAILHLASPTQGTVVDFLLEAMRQALAIYFYRRIYDLDPSLLQSKVALVQSCLLQYAAGSSDGSQGSARMVWPVFIAACEAEAAAFNVFRRWFKQSAEATGLALFAAALNNVERIRDAKVRHLSSTFRWSDAVESVNMPGVAVREHFDT